MASAGNARGFIVYDFMRIRNIKGDAGASDFYVLFPDCPPSILLLFYPGDIQTWKSAMECSTISQFSAYSIEDTAALLLKNFVDAIVVIALPV